MIIKCCHEEEDYFCKRFAFKIFYFDRFLIVRVPNLHENLAKTFSKITLKSRDVAQETITCQISSHCLVVISHLCKEMPIVTFP